MRMMYYSVSDTGNLGKKEIRVLLSGVVPKTFPLLGPSDALPLSYRRLVRTKAKGLMGQTSYILLGFECQVKLVCYCVNQIIQ